MIFRLISSQLGSPSPDYGSHIIMSISGISLHINPHIISSSSPILISGARNNINHIHNISCQIYVCCRQQPGTNWLLPPDPEASPYIAGSRLLVRGQTAPRVLERGHLPTCPTSLSADSPAHQCAWSATLHLNIDLSLTVLRTTSPDKYRNIYGQVQSRPECTPNTCKYLNCYTCSDM